MDIILWNFLWMGWNSLLALIGMFFGRYLYKKYIEYKEGKDLKILKLTLYSKKAFKTYMGFIFFTWLLFVPNTAYIFTDIIHLFPQVNKLGGIYNVLLFTQYFVFMSIGFVTYYLGVNYFNRFLNKTNKLILNKNIVISISVLLISLGVTIGRFARTNSWYIVTQPLRVLNDIYSILSSVDTVLYFLFIFIFLNFVYFCSKYLLKHFIKVRID